MADAWDGDTLTVTVTIVVATPATFVATYRLDPEQAAAVLSGTPVEADPVQSEPALVDWPGLEGCSPDELDAIDASVADAIRGLLQVHPSARLAVEAAAHAAGGEE